MVLYSESLMAFPVSRQVSPDEINQVINSGKATKVRYYLVAQNSQKNEEEKKDRKETSPGPDFIDAIDVSTHATGSSSEEFALVMFAVVGLVLIVAWIPYVPMLIYEGSRGKDFDHLVQLNWNPVIGNDQRDKHGFMNGLNYGFYLEESHIGLSLESGYYNIGGNNGAYWMAGPSVVFGELKPETLFGRVDLLAGTSFDPNLGLMSRAEFSGNWMTKDNFTFGVSIGGLLLNHREEDPLAGRTGQLGILLGLKAGYKF